MAIAEKRKQRPESLAQEVLRNLVRQFTDEDLLEQSLAATRRAPFRIEESEEVVRQYRRSRKTR